VFKVKEGLYQGEEGKEGRFSKTIVGKGGGGTLRRWRKDEHFGERKKGGKNEN